MGSALLSTPPEPAPPSADGLRLQAAERLAAHRSRRGSQPVAAELSPPQPAAASSPHNTRSSRIAATVAERYANSPSYRAVLAAHAERAIQEARAAAETAARNAQAIALAQQQLLDDLKAEALIPQTYPEEFQASQLTAQPFLLEPQSLRAFAPAKPQSTPAFDSDSFPSRPTPSITPTQLLTVRLYDGSASTEVLLSRTSAPPAGQSPHFNSAESLDSSALDEEIAFRHDPVFEEPAEPPVPLVANLLEFPRQLVAPRKVRPRYAEGPLRDESAPANSQLRIFEVAADQISTTPAPDEPTSPQWTSLWLEPSAPAPPTAERAADLYTATAGDLHPTARPHTAAISRRLLAAAVDATIVLAAFFVFSTVFVLTVSHGHPPAFADVVHSLAPQPSLQPATPAKLHSGQYIDPQLTLAIAAICASFAFLYLLYQALFFSLSDATPGMRHARIALCTFADDNPTRPAIRRRLLAVMLSTAPLGLGLLWALIDEDRLAWHDRLTRIYQRSY